MHPVKAQSDIRLALERYGIRVLSLDHEDEIAKLLRIVHALDIDPGEITLFVRLQTKGAGRLRAFTEIRRGAVACGGAAAAHRPDRLPRRPLLPCRQPDRGRRTSTSARSPPPIGCGAEPALSSSASMSAAAFPAPYGYDPRRAKPSLPRLPELMADLRRHIGEWGFSDLPLIAEPGRVIVARSLSVIVRVLLKKGRRLYINDGIWGSLSDSWTGKITLPARLIHDPARKRRSGNPRELAPFSVCGATCDSVDILSRPFWLPETVDTGDWVEIGHIGAYSLALRTRFNGFYPDTFVEVETPFEDEEGAKALPAIETMAD